MVEHPHLSATEHHSATEHLSATTTVRTAATGELLVEKRFGAVGGESGTHEAAWLAKANHPGVVRLLRRDEHHDINVMAHVSGPTLRTCAPRPSEAARILASVAETLADLHDSGLVHGAVHPDHILVSKPGGEPLRSVLCSPTAVTSSSNLGEPSVDIRGLGQCVRWLAEQWTELGMTAPSAWNDLANRLLLDQPMTARRATEQFNRLAAPARHRVRRASTIPISRMRRFRFVSATTMSVLVASLTTLVALIIWSNGADRQQIGALRVHSGSAVFAVGHERDVVVALPSPCPGQPAALLLSHRTADVFTFNRLEDGSVAVPMATVPGATGLRVSPAVPCPRVWATGPAGEVELDWP